MPTNVCQNKYYAPLPHLAAPQESVIHFSYGGPHQDWYYGLLKSIFTRLPGLSDLKTVVNVCAEASISQLVSTQSGEVVVPTYN